MSIDFIWFDLGYTLLYLEREKLFAKVIGKFDIQRTLDDIEKAFHLSDKCLMREHPGLLARSSEEFMPLYFGLLCDRLDIHGNLVSLLGAWMDEWKKGGLRWLAYPNAHAVLDRLSAKGFRLGVISNWDSSARSVLASCGLQDRFEVVVISSEVGIAKPDERIFRLAMQSAKVDPSRCLYIGDNYYDDAVGAASVGMKYLIVNKLDNLGIEELEGKPLARDISGVFSYLGSEKP